MRSNRRPRLALAAAAVFALCFFLLVASSSRASTSAIGRLSTHAPQLPKGGLVGSASAGDLGYGERYSGRSSADINRVTNGTLGFSKVIVVGLPERTDKRDALALMSSMTGFGLDWVDGVKGADIPEKARPFGYKGTRLTENYLGSWRGHMNAIRRIVEEGLPSALIMEDDMDWDVRLKAQLELIAEGARAVFPMSSHHVPDSPYGDDWDLLWLGHCGEPFPEDLDENRKLEASDPRRLSMTRRYTILDDKTVPPLERLTGLIKFKEYPPQTRWVHVTAAPICTFAYALSQRGARKVLHSLSVDGIGEPYDNALAWLCRRSLDNLVEQRLPKGEADGEKRLLDLKCLTVTPPIFFHHRAKGLVAADSDINKVDADDKLAGEGNDGKIREKGSTENIVWSMRLNMKNILAGRPIQEQ